jgi:universal stress protein A
MFKKILVATDLRDTSQQALATAAEMAREHKSTLLVVNVVPDPMNQPWVIEAYGVDWIRVREDVCRAAAGELNKLVSDIAPSSPRVETEVLIGVPAAEIVRYAREHGVDLMVVGTHGRGQLRRAFLGSVADRVVREASCPVLVVRGRIRRAVRVAHAA